MKKALVDELKASAPAGHGRPRRSGLPVALPVKYSLHLA